MDEIEESIAKVDEMMRPEKFSIVDAIKGSSRPTDTVRVYTDTQAGQDIVRLNTQMEALANQRERGAKIDQDFYDELEQEAQEVREQLLASSYIFTLQGLPRDEWENDRNRLADAEDQTKAGHEYTMLILARSIVQVEDNDGMVDDHDFTPDEAEVIYNMLPPGEWDRINAVIQQLTFASAYFDKAVDAGFLPQR